MKQFVSLILVLAASLGICSTNNVFATTITDDFSTSHNYLADGVTGTIWDGILHAENAASMDANTSNAGKLTISLTGTASGYGDSMVYSNAPFLYKNVDLSQNFTMQAKTADAVFAGYDVLGLMVYKSTYNYTSVNQNYFGETPEAANVEVRTVIDGIQSGAGIATGVGHYLKLSWTAATSTFNLACSTDGTNWIGSTDIVRTDLSGSAYAGIYFGDYAAATSGERIAQYDSFSLTTVPEPVSLVVLATGLVSLLAYAWRKRR